MSMRRGAPAASAAAISWRTPSSVVTRAAATPKDRASATKSMAGSVEVHGDIAAGLGGMPAQRLRSLLQDAIGAVVEDDEHDGQALMRRGPERLDVVQGAAVADEGDHGPRRSASLTPIGGRQPPADAAAAHAEEALRIVAGNELAQPAGRGERLLDDDDVLGQHLADAPARARAAGSAASPPRPARGPAAPRARRRSPLPSSPVLRRRGAAARRASTAPATAGSSSAASPSDRRGSRPRSRNSCRAARDRCRDGPPSCPAEWPRRSDGSDSVKRSRADREQQVMRVERRADCGAMPRDRAAEQRMRCSERARVLSMPSSGPARRAPRRAAELGPGAARAPRRRRR